MAALVGLNLAFYRFLTRTKGGWFAIVSICWHLIYYACCGISVAVALGIWHLGPRQRFDESTGHAGHRLDPAASPHSTPTPAPHHGLAANRAPTSTQKSQFS